MARKKPSLSSVVAFMSDNTQARIEAQSQAPGLLSLDSIRPDFSQPRQLLPRALVEPLKQGQITPVEALQAWLRQAKGDPAGQQKIDKLKQLADSIARHGLINPISVRLPLPTEIVPPGAEYLIITGERRYWAHIYLLSEGKQIQDGQTRVDPSQIKATLAATGVTIRAHQLVENLLREDINAVEKAHGMWALRYELSGVNYSSPALDGRSGVNYSSPAPGNTANDGRQNLVPWSQVEKTLGISKRYRIYVTSVLNLCSEAQELVASYNLAEMTIRPIVQKLKEKPDLQLVALQQLIAWQAENETTEAPGRATVVSVKDLVEKLLAGELKQATKPKITRSVSSEPVIRFQDKVRTTLDFLNRLKPTDRAGLTKALGRDEFAEVMIDLRNLRQQLDTILEDATRSQLADDHS